jgi:hypothetical protein
MDARSRALEEADKRLFDEYVALHKREESGELTREEAKPLKKEKMSELLSTRMPFINPHFVPYHYWTARYQKDVGARHALLYGNRTEAGQWYGNMQEMEKDQPVPKYMHPYLNVGWTPSTPDPAKNPFDAPPTPETPLAFWLQALAMIPVILA